MGRYLLVLIVTLFGCEPSETMPLLPVGDGPHGPGIIFDPLARPVADIPLPNDLALIADSTTRTGLSWNTSLIQPTAHQRELRAKLNRLDGFGPFGPIFLTFDGPLDLATITNESVVLVNIEPNHPREGERIPLDLGRGYFPGHMRPHEFFGHDIMKDFPSLLLPEANLADFDGDGEEELLTHYALDSRILIARPVMALAQGARHAVLITRDVYGQGIDGTIGSVRSPFVSKSHTAQESLIARALELTNISPGELAFGWTYTTANIVAPLIDLREGLYGRGLFSRFADIVGPEITKIRDTSVPGDGRLDGYEPSPDDHQYILQAEFLTKLLDIFATIQDDENFAIQFFNVDYLVFGSWDTPNIRDTPLRNLGIDLHTGEGEVSVEEVPFLISIPKTTEKHKPPFPVALYFHGTNTSRFEPLAIADDMARQGIAMISFDQVGHGPTLQDVERQLIENPEYEALAPVVVPLIVDLLVPDRVAEFEGLGLAETLEKLKGVGLFAELFVHGRAEDINQDGRFEPAESFFYADPTRMCASFQQDLVDMLQMVRVLRGLSQAAVPDQPLANPETASFEALKPYLFSGDFNADGVLDLGGPDVPLTLAGTSLGGFHAIMGAAIEPEIKTVTPIVAGGGFLDIMTRSKLHFILEPLLNEVMGNLVVGCEKEGVLYLTQGNLANRCREPEDVAFARRAPVPEGTRVRLTNEVNGETVETTVNEKGGFAFGVETDLKDPLSITFDMSGEAETVFETEAVVRGNGYERNSRDFMRSALLQQHGFDQCDPINFVRHLLWEPWPGHPPTNVLFFNAVGDQTVPISTGMMAALGAGVFGRQESEWSAEIARYIDVGLFDGERYDVDDILGNNPPEEPGLGPAQPITTLTGVSSIRLADVNGKHEWIAGYVNDDFEFGRYTRQQLVIYHKCQGRLILDQPADCLQHYDCELMDDVTALDGCLPE